LAVIPKEVVEVELRREFGICLHLLYRGENEHRIFLGLSRQILKLIVSFVEGIEVDKDGIE
jgi:hypothetical protein